MKVLTLIQPWATLVVIGAKKIETRGFNTTYKGEILIHASGTLDSMQTDFANYHDFKKALSGHEDLPMGVIIGKVTIDGTFKTEIADDFFFENDRFYGNKKTKLAWEKKWDENVKREKAFGNYSPGRFGWELYEPVAFTNHTPFKGGVGFTKRFDDRICLVCGCTEMNCKACIEKTGMPCSWVSFNLCSACKK